MLFNLWCIIMSKSWRSKSITILLVLFSVSVLLFAFTFVNSTPYTGQSIADTYNLSIGQSIFAGDSIVGENETIQLPLLSNLGFIGHQLMAFDLHGILMSVSTGVVPFDFTTVSIFLYSSPVKPRVYSLDNSTISSTDFVSFMKLLSKSCHLIFPSSILSNPNLSGPNLRSLETLEVVNK